MSAEGSETTTDIVELAKAYTEALDSEFNETRKEELSERIQQGEERRERLIEEHGKDHHLVTKVESTIDELKSELEEIKSTEENAEERREELLEAVAEGFELQGPWLEDDVICAATHALYGERDEEYVVLKREIRSEADVADIDDFDIIDMEDIVTLLARDALGETAVVKEAWEKFKGSANYPTFTVVSEHGPVGPSEVSDHLDKDYDTVNNWLKSPINFYDRFIPYYRPEEGTYWLSTTGRYYAARFEDSMELESSDTETEQEFDEEESERSSQTDVTKDFKAGQTESSAGEGEGQSIEDIEDTEEKADEFFSAMGDGSE